MARSPRPPTSKERGGRKARAEGTGSAKAGASEGGASRRRARSRRSLFSSGRSSSKRRLWRLEPSPTRCPARAPCVRRVPLRKSVWEIWPWRYPLTTRTETIVQPGGNKAFQWSHLTIAPAMMGAVRRGKLWALRTRIKAQRAGIGRSDARFQNANHVDGSFLVRR